MAANDRTQEILSKLDILAEYAELGVTPAGMPRDNDCAECFAFGRKDGKPSAWVNVKTGRYGDKGTGEHFSLWDFCVAKFPEKFKDWFAARDHFAEKVGMEAPKRGRPSKLQQAKKKAASAVESVGFFEDWNSGNLRLLSTWCLLYKKGVTPEAVLEVGGRVAYWSCYRKKDASGKPTGELRRGDQKVIALPCYLPTDDPTTATPSAWVIYNLVGPKLVKYSGHDQPATLEKMLSIGPTAGTLMNSAALAKLKEGGQFTITKTGGPSDMMALLAALRSAEARGESHAGHLIITNASGESGDVSPEQASAFAGQRAALVHDADHAGELGAAKWEKRTVPAASEVRRVRLPFEIREKHGLDLRDWLNGVPERDGVPEQDIKPRGFADFLALIEATPVSGVEAVLAAPKPRKKGDAPDPPADAEAAADVAPPADTEADPAVPTAAGSPFPRSAAEAADYSEEEAACRLMGIEVLGETENGSVELFSCHHRKVEKFSDVSRLAYDRLLQFGGQPFRDNVTDEAEPTKTQQLTFKAARSAIAALAGCRKITSSNKLGAGCWQGADDAAEHPSILCVGPVGAVEWNGTGKLRYVAAPRHRDKILNFAGGEEWFDEAKLRSLLESEDRSWTATAFDDLVKILSQWRWKQPQAAEIAAALIFATWVQSLWKWRPLVAVAGASNTGKSTLFEFLAALYGPLSQCPGDPSPAGLRQLMKDSSSATLLDEFEQSKHRGPILKMLRLSGRGGKVVRGTTHHQAEGFVLRHIVWVAAIEVNLQDEADANRFICLELVKPEADKQNKLKLPSPLEAAELGQRTLAAAMLHIHEAKRIALNLKTTGVEGVHSRVIESYAVPAAMMALCRGKDEEFARRWLADVAAESVQDNPATPDEVMLLEFILQKRIAFGLGVEYTVSEILLEDLPKGVDLAKVESQLTRLGVKWYRPSKGEVKDLSGRGMTPEGLFVSNGVADDLLRDTRWKGQSIGQILMRTPGAHRVRPRLAGTPTRGTWIPRDFLEREGGPLGPCDSDADADLPPEF